MNEVTDLLAAYFKGTKRRPQESMNDYITRKTEAYMRACQALRRVQPHYEPSVKNDRYPWRRQSGDWSSRAWGRQWTPASEMEGTTVAEEAEDRTEETETTTAGSESWRQGPNHDWWAQGSWGRGSTTSSTTEEVPAFIQGWHLLADASLESHERNLVMTGLNGNFTPVRVAQELRNQFSEHEVKRRDQSRRHMGYLGEAWEADEEEELDGDLATDEIEGTLNDEGFALVSLAEEEAESAMAAMQTARRTLRDARQRQHQVKQSRKYFQSTTNRSTAASSSSRPRDDSNLDCLRCGKRGHQAANCPHKPIGDGPTQAHMTAGDDNQHAPFVCYTSAPNQEQDETLIETILHDNFVGYATELGYQAENYEKESGLTTKEAVSRGYAVVDGGATQTIGSVAALEAVLQQNRQKHGSSGLKGLSSEEPPTFSFGNSTENKCLSTAQIRVQANGNPGELRVHTLEGGEAPILLSIQTLRALKAVIDFEADVAVFSGPGPSPPCTFRAREFRTPVVVPDDDWMSNATCTAQAIPSLLSYAPH